MNGAVSTDRLTAITARRASACTSAGVTDRVNEDAILLRSWPGDDDALLAVVADGMGSYGGGDIAAGIVIDTFAELLNTPLPPTRAERSESLLAAFYRADARIRERGADGFAEMGATVASAIITPGELLHLYAGDCRLYLIRGGDIIYRTRDHSAVQVLVDSGRLRADEASSHPMRSLVTSCLGGPGEFARLTIDPFVAPDAADESNSAIRPLSGEDVIVLCSDGLWSEVSDADLSAAVRCRVVDESVEDLARDLVNIVINAGGVDNISVIVIVAAGLTSCT